MPIEGLSREFAAGATSVDICARTMRAMMDVGARHFYISNLPLHTAASTLSEILDRIGAKASGRVGRRADRRVVISGGVRRRRGLSRR